MRCLRMYVVECVLKGVCLAFVVSIACMLWKALSDLVFESIMASAELGSMRRAFVWWELLRPSPNVSATTGKCS